jgi:hypothetical protein
MVNKEFALKISCLFWRCYYHSCTLVCYTDIIEECHRCLSFELSPLFICWHDSFSLCARCYLFVLLGILTMQHGLFNVAFLYKLIFEIHNDHLMFVPVIDYF